MSARRRRHTLKETFVCTSEQGREALDETSRGSRRCYSHSMVPGGLLVTSSTTRLTSGTSLVMRVEIRSNTS